MSLKFGIYLVEQRIISPEQFCGLVKIQQEASMSLATIALRKNFMTIKQVARVLDLQEANPQHSFIEIATNEELIDNSDGDRMIHEQRLSCPSIQKLVVECGLLTKHQVAVLSHHADRQAAAKDSRTTVATPSTATPVKGAPEVTMPESNVAAPKAPITASPRQPKFTRRPVQTFSSQID